MSRSRSVAAAAADAGSSSWNSNRYSSSSTSSSTSSSSSNVQRLNAMYNASYLQSGTGPLCDNMRIMNKQSSSLLLMP